MRLPTYSPLLTDLYQLTMAYGYWKLGMHEQTAVFHLLFRKNPFKGNYALNCGLGALVNFLNEWHFQEDDLAYLATLKNAAQEPLFPPAFLNYLSQLRFTCDIDAISEGIIVFPNEPLLRIQGPLLQCQLLESPLLNILNFQTLIATKTTRVCRAAQGDEVIEFGMRRAQGPDGALSASRAAYIGGCVATSNTLAGKLYDIPVRGTHAHSWVTAFNSEAQAFQAYADVLAQNCVLLVDTYNTLKGVDHAIEVGKRLRQQGADLLAIRLDSGDMAQLSKAARKRLDDAGFANTGILASNSLDEYVISNLKSRGAAISSWGVGTNLATAYDQPALDGVYKLSALQSTNGKWEYKLKISEDLIKVTTPGRQQVRRFFSNNRFIMDVVYDLDLGIADTPNAILQNPNQEIKTLGKSDKFVDLLQPIFRKGKLLPDQKNIHVIRKQAMQEAEHFYRSHGEEAYPVSLEENLFKLKQGLLKDLKKQ